MVGSSTAAPTVGCVDVRTPRTRATTRVFYPAAAGAAAASFPTASLLPRRGGALYAAQLVRFGLCAHALPRGSLWRRAADALCGAAGLLMRAAASAFPSSFASGAGVDVRAGAPPAEGGARLPAVVFAHGLGGNRALYSGLCARVAAAGFVVAAVEFTDGSASNAEVASDAGGGALGGDGFLRYAGTVSLKRRREQQDERLAQCLDAVELLEAVGAGGMAGVAEGLVDRGGAVALDALRGRVDASRALLMGHSFGGLTAARAVAREERFVAAAALDPWLVALESEGDFGGATPKPLLVIMSEWNDWWREDHYSPPAHPPGCNKTTVREMWEARAGRAGGRGRHDDKWFVRAPGTTHKTATDLPFLPVPGFLKSVSGGVTAARKVGLEEAIDGYAAMVVGFFADRLLEEVEGKEAGAFDLARARFERLLDGDGLSS